MGWIRGLGNRLGYGGRSDRREFVAGAALTVVGPYALSLAIKGSINTLFAVFPRTVALILALVLTVMVCAAIVAWFWGWSALLTRRARDVGLPAWAGLASLFVLWAAMTGLKVFAPPGYLRLDQFPRLHGLRAGLVGLAERGRVMGSGAVARYAGAHVSRAGLTSRHKRKRPPRRPGQAFLIV